MSRRGLVVANGTVARECPWYCGFCRDIGGRESIPSIRGFRAMNMHTSGNEHSERRVTPRSRQASVCGVTERHCEIRVTAVLVETSYQASITRAVCAGY
jgi:hypothetical protein